MQRKVLIAIDRNLKFATKRDLKNALGFERFYKLTAAVDQKYGKTTVPLLKSFIKDNEDLTAIIEANGDLAKKYAQKQLERGSKKYKERVERHTQINQALSLPKRQYKGCLASRLDPEDYEFCNESYDDPEESYQKYSSLVPYNKLRQSEYLKAVKRNDVRAMGILAFPREGKTPNIRDLPLGIRKYMQDNPEDYEDYLGEVQAEANYLAAIKRSVKKGTRKERKALWDQLQNVAEGEESMEIM